MESLDRCGRYYHGLRADADVKSALLGKEPRYAPDRRFDTLHIRLELVLDFRQRRVRGRCITRVRAINDGLRVLSFDAARMRVAVVTVEGAKTRHRHDGDHLAVRLPRPLKSGEETEIEIVYRLDKPEIGLHFVPCHGAAVQVWSQGQPEYSRCWFPCHDAPHEKATSEVIAVVPRGFVAVSNGVLADKREGPRTATYHWRMDQPHSVYLIALAAGRFGIVEDRWRDVPLAVYCERGRESDARRGLGKTAKAMEFFSSSIGVPYPFERYSQVCARDFSGGMENTAATFMTEACLVDKRAALDTDVDLLMSHELAHQWFGDLLTCRDWSHAWLNEGFATYFETLFTLHDKGQDEFDYELDRNAQAYFHEEKERYSRPIVCRIFKNPAVIFDRHLYEKAAAVLHMLRHELGDGLWWKSIGHYVRKHRDSSVETDDLILAIEEATGRNLRPFFDQWIYRRGHPVFDIRQSWAPKSKTATIRLRQSQPVSDENPAFKMDVLFRFEGGGWTRTFSRAVSEKEHHWTFRLPGPPLSVEFDPEHRILKRVQFKKPWAMWERQLRRAPRAMSRALAAHEVARQGGNRAASALSGALRRERFWGAAAEIASALGSMGTPAAFGALRRAAGHGHPKVRRAVLDALSGFRNPDAAGLLLSALRRDPSIHAAAAAARSLGSLRDPRHAGALRSSLSRKSYSDVIQGGAIQGLAAIRDRALVPVLRRESLPDRTFPARGHAMRALAALAPVAPEVVSWLCGYARETDERIALTAIHALASTEDAGALPVLEKLQKTSPDMRIRAYAAEAAARIKSGFSSLNKNSGA